MNVTIEIIPHKKQRYSTCGDWQFDKKGNLKISVSKLSDWRHEMLVAVHELCETLMCIDAGVSQEAVDEFDMRFEKNRKPGDDSEPGDYLTCPYRYQHFRATNIERVLADNLGVDFKAYEDELNDLP